MQKALMLVDYENVQDVDVAAIPGRFGVTILVGARQKNIPVERVKAMQKYGSRITWMQIKGIGKNALDFHIAYYLGKALQAEPDKECIILSKDKGYDPLVAHLKSEGKKVRRLNSLLELEPVPKRKPGPDTGRVLEILAKTPKTNRPRKRTTLASHIASNIFRERKDVDPVKIIDELFASGKITEKAGQLSYSD